MLVKIFIQLFVVLKELLHECKSNVVEVFESQEPICSNWNGVIVMDLLLEPGDQFYQIVF